MDFLLVMQCTTAGTRAATIQRDEDAVRLKMTMRRMRQAANEAKKKFSILVQNK